MVMHGLFSSSEVFVINPGDQSLGMFFGKFPLAAVLYVVFLQHSTWPIVDTMCGCQIPEEVEMHEIM